MYVSRHIHIQRTSGALSLSKTRGDRKIKINNPRTRYLGKSCFNMCESECKRKNSKIFINDFKNLNADRQKSKKSHIGKSKNTSKKCVLVGRPKIEIRVSTSKQQHTTFPPMY